MTFHCFWCECQPKRLWKSETCVPACKWHCVTPELHTVTCTSFLGWAGTPNTFATVLDIIEYDAFQTTRQKKKKEEKKREWRWGEKKEAVHCGTGSKHRWTNNLEFKRFSYSGPNPMALENLQRTLKSWTTGGSCLSVKFHLDFTPSFRVCPSRF